MGIFGALTTAVAGMRAQAFALQNISGNIANSQTTAFKRMDTSFEDLIPDGAPNQQLSGNVVANSSSTNTVQGDIQSASISTYMAINGQGFFVVEKPTGFTDNRPSFAGVDQYSRRGDFQIDKSGYLVNRRWLLPDGHPDRLHDRQPDRQRPDDAAIPERLLARSSDNHSSVPSQPGEPIRRRRTATPSVVGSELLNQSNFSANPVVGAATAAKLIGSGATLSADAAAVVTGSGPYSSREVPVGGTLDITLGATTPITITAGDDMPRRSCPTSIRRNRQYRCASLDTSTGNLVLTGTDTVSNINIDGTASTLTVLGELGLSGGITNATNLLTQSAASSGQTLTFTVGYNPPAAPTNPPLLDDMFGTARRSGRDDRVS